MLFLQIKTTIVVIVWMGIHSRSDTIRTGSEGLFFYYPRLLYCLNQMLAVMLLSQHQVFSSKTISPCGARCMGHTIRMWSVVCSAVLHLQFSEGVRPCLCIYKWNHPIPVHSKWLSLTQAVQGKPISTGLALVLGIKTWSLEVFSQYSAFHLWFVHSEAQMPSLARLFKRFCAQLAQMGI